MGEPGPRQLGDYRIVEFIGGGGMGRVYRAQHVHLRKIYALKVLSPELCGDPGFIDRFHGEARVMAELKHPHIVEVHNLGHAGGEYFLVMDYVAGPGGAPMSLQSVLARCGSGRLPAGRVRKWAVQIAEALAYAHRQGVVHRDIKPANVMVDAEDGVRLSDFGLAKVVGQDVQNSRTAKLAEQSLSGPETLVARGPGPSEDPLDAAATMLPGADRTDGPSSAAEIMGTYDYMAPEQREGGRVDQRTDIYAFGVLVYRLLTGRRPVGSVAPPSKVVRGLHEQWDTIHDRCLAYAPEERYPSADALLADLRLLPDETVLQDQAAEAARLLADGGLASAREIVEELLRQGKAGQALAEPLLAELWEQAEQHCAQAGRCLETGDLVQASQCLQQAEEANPNSTRLSELRKQLDSHAEVGRISKRIDGYLAAGDYARAHAELEKLADHGELGSRQAEMARLRFDALATELAQKATDALKARQGQQAVGLARSALDLSPHNERARQIVDHVETLARTSSLRQEIDELLRQRQFGRARDLLVDLGSLPPPGPKLAEPLEQRLQQAATALANEALQDVHRDHWSDARQKLEQALRAYPEYPYARDMLGDVTEELERRGRNRKALRWVVPAACVGVALPLVVFFLHGRASRPAAPPPRHGSEAPKATAGRPVIAPRPAPPQPPEGTGRQAAKKLWDEATDLVSRGQYVPAWQKLMDSYRADPEGAGAPHALYAAGLHAQRVGNVEGTRQAWSVLIGDFAQKRPGDRWEIEDAKIREAQQWLQAHPVAGPRAQDARFEKHLSEAQRLFGQEKVPQAEAAIRAALGLRPNDGVALAVASQIETAKTYPPCLTLDLGPNVAMKLVLIPAGKFLMGSPASEEGREEDEGPQHEVTISNPLYVGITEVTRRQFAAFVDETGHTTGAETGATSYAWDGSAWAPAGKPTWRKPGFPQTDDHPAVCLTWHDAEAFCRWLTRRTGRTVRLPTEAEWEYACRAGAGMRYPWGQTWDPKESNFADKETTFPWSDKTADDGSQFTAPVGQYKGNAWGLLDMLGNAQEWCRDRYDARYYRVSSSRNPQGPMSGQYCVLRGSSWVSQAAWSRCAKRAARPPEETGYDRSFRAVVECSRQATTAPAATSSPSAPSPSRPARPAGPPTQPARSPEEVQHEKLMTEGRAHLAGKRWDEARQCFLKAQQWRNTPEAREAVAETRYQQYLGMGRQALARKDCRGALGYFNLAKGFKDTPELRGLIAEAERELKTQR